MSEATGDTARRWFPGGERLAFLLMLVGVLYAAYRVVRPILVALLLAAAVASLSYRLYERAVAALRGRRRAGAALCVTGLLGCILAPFTLLGVFLGRRLITEIGELARSLEAGGPEGVVGLADRLGPLGPPVRRVLARLGPAVSQAVPALAQRVAGALGAFGGAVLQILLGLFLLTISVYYFYLHGRAWQERAVHLVPLDAADVRAFFRRFHQVSVGVLVGNLGTALAQGIVAAGGYLALGAPVPVVWGLVTAAASLVPAVGTTIVWGPLSIYVGATAGWWRGVALALYGVLAIGSVDNLLRPALTRRSLRIHPLFAFVAVFGGVAAYGIAGLFLGPLVIALTITVLDLYEQHLGRPFS